MLFAATGRPWSGRACGRRSVHSQIEKAAAGMRTAYRLFHRPQSAGGSVEPQESGIGVGPCLRGGRLHITPVQPSS